MTDTKNLPHVLRLLDDESKIVQEAIIKELLTYGASLFKKLEKLEKPAAPLQIRQIKVLLENHKREVFKQEWSQWQKFADGNEKLENALALVSDYLGDLFSNSDLKGMLDDLAGEYAAKYTDKNAKKLSHFLFAEKGLKGSEENYYHPMHSDLSYVIKHKQGLPISLACIYILVGWRFGLHIEGCNFPGHFLAKTTLGSETILVDCFNGGRIMTKTAFENVKPSESIQEILESSISSEIIMIRVFNNLTRAFKLSGENDSYEFFAAILKEMKTSQEEDKETWK